MGLYPGTFKVVPLGMRSVMGASSEGAWFTRYAKAADGEYAMLLVRALGGRVRYCNSPETSADRKSQHKPRHSRKRPPVQALISLNHLARRLA